MRETRDPLLAGVYPERWRCPDLLYAPRTMCYVLLYQQGQQQGGYTQQGQGYARCA